MKNTITGALMVQGTTSDAGKSTLVTAICRILHRRGISVAPFKPQNMALNSAVTPNGGEIGRAQALQAAACGLAPNSLFNPVLLKPSSDQRSQVILNGKTVDQLDASKFGSIKGLAFNTVMESYQTLRRQYDVVVIEGAGSPAEINLRENDIANMGFAEAADCPVILIGDIDKGGIFAHLTGTVNLLSESEQTRIKGFVINRFRGSLNLLQSGLDWLEADSKRPVLGVIPYLKGLKLDAEDAISPTPQNKASNLVRIKVPVFSRISNHTDFDPLANHPGVSLEYIGPGDSLDNCDLIILPGSKNVRAEVSFMASNQWDVQVLKHLRYGGKLLGICGGFQLLGKTIADPNGIEDVPGNSPGLGLLEFETTLLPEKQLKQIEGTLSIEGNEAAIKGYEIHCGISAGEALSSFACEIKDQQGDTYRDGAISHDGQIIGTYVHGLFETGSATEAILEWVSGTEHAAEDWDKVREREIDRLADVVEQSLDLEQLLQIIQ